MNFHNLLSYCFNIQNVLQHTENCCMYLEPPTKEMSGNKAIHFVLHTQNHRLL